jgi:hypothetical protein
MQQYGGTAPLSLEDQVLGVSQAARSDRTPRFGAESCNGSLPPITERLLALWRQPLILARLFDPDDGLTAIELAAADRRRADAGAGSNAPLGVT